MITEGEVTIKLFCSIYRDPFEAQGSVFVRWTEAILSIFMGAWSLGRSGIRILVLQCILIHF
jgi:hypothetical protein